MEVDNPLPVVIPTSSSDGTTNQTSNSTPVTVETKSSSLNASPPPTEIPDKDVLSAVLQL